MPHEDGIYAQEGSNKHKGNKNSNYTSGSSEDVNVEEKFKNKEYHYNGRCCVWYRKEPSMLFLMYWCGILLSGFDKKLNVKDNDIKFRSSLFVMETGNAKYVNS